SELDQQGVGQEDVAGPAVLGDLGPQPDAILRPAIRRVDIADVQTYNLGQPEAGSECQRVNQVVPGIAARGAKDCSLLGLRQGLRAEVGHRGLSSVTIHAWIGREVKL